MLISERDQIEPETDFDFEGFKKDLDGVLNKHINIGLVIQEGGGMEN